MNEALNRHMFFLELQPEFAEPPPNAPGINGGNGSGGIVVVTEYCAS